MVSPRIHSWAFFVLSIHKDCEETLNTLSKDLKELVLWIDISKHLFNFKSKTKYIFCSENKYKNYSNLSAGDVPLQRDEQTFLGVNVDEQVK